jgi:hypothetical protein
VSLFDKIRECECEKVSKHIRSGAYRVLPRQE